MNAALVRLDVRTAPRFRQPILVSDQAGLVVAGADEDRLFDESAPQLHRGGWS